MNKLPKVYANTNLGNIKNNETIYYDNKKIKTNNIDYKINQIFKSSKYVYKIDVRITTTKNIDTYKVIGKSNNCLITINNEKIPINDIIDIEEV